MSKLDKPEPKDGLSRRDFLQSGSAITLLATLSAVSSAAQPAHDFDSAGTETKNAPGDLESEAGFPRVWMSSPENALPTANFKDLASHGVQVIETTDIQSARKHGLKVMLASDVDGMFMGEIIGSKDV